MQVPPCQCERTRSHPPVPPEPQTKNDFGAFFPEYSQHSQQERPLEPKRLDPKEGLRCVERQVEGEVFS